MALKAAATADAVETVAAATVPAVADVGLDTASSGRRLLSNIGYLAGSQLTTWVATLLYTVIVTRAIGPQGNGELSSAAAVFSVLSMLVGLGTATYIVKEVARDRSRASQLTVTALAVQAAALLPAVVGLASYLALHRFGFEMTVVILLYSMAVVPAVFASTLQSALQGIQRMGVIAAGGVAANLVFNLASVALVLLHHADVALIAIVAMVTQTVSAAVSWAGYRRHFRGRWHTSFTAMVRLTREAVPFLATAVAFTLYVAADTIILTTLSTATEVGWYAAANRLFATLLVVASILGTVWLPRLTAHAHDGAAALAGEARLLTRLGLLSAIPVAIGGAMVAGRVVLLIWGAPFLGAIAPLVVLLITLPATSACMVIYQVLVAKELAGRWARVMAVALPVNVVANVIGILVFRSVGQSTALAAALCLALTEYGMAVTAIWMARRELGSATLLYALRVLIASGMMAVVVLLVSRLPLAAVIGIGALAFGFAGVLVRVVTKQELLVARALAGRVLRR